VNEEVSRVITCEADGMNLGVVYMLTLTAVCSAADTDLAP